MIYLVLGDYLGRFFIILSQEVVHSEFISETIGAINSIIETTVASSLPLPDQYWYIIQRLLSWRTYIEFGTLNLKCKEMIWEIVPVDVWLTLLMCAECRNIAKTIHLQNNIFTILTLLQLHSCSQICILVLVVYLWGLFHHSWASHITLLGRSY